MLCRGVLLCSISFLIHSKNGQLPEILPLVCSTALAGGGLLCSISFLVHGKNGQLPEIPPLVCSTRLFWAWLSNSLPCKRRSQRILCQPSPVLSALPRSVLCTPKYFSQRALHLVTHFLIDAEAPCGLTSSVSPSSCLVWV